MVPKVGEDEEQKDKSKSKGMVLELLEDGELVLEECPKSAEDCRVNGKYVSCMRIGLASLSWK